MQWQRDNDAFICQAMLCNLDTSVELSRVRITLTPLVNEIDPFQLRVKQYTPLVCFMMLMMHDVGAKDYDNVSLSPGVWNVENC